MFGLGGINIELFEVVSFRVLLNETLTTARYRAARGKPLYRRMKTGFPHRPLACSTKRG